MKLIDLYEEHYAPARLIQANPHTKDRFRYEIRRLAELLGRTPTTADLNTNTISRLMSQGIEQGLSTETVAGTRKKFVALWRFAHQRRFVEEYPDVPDIKVERDPPVAWTREEMEKLLSVCAKQKGYMCGVPANLWWHSLHIVALDTGTRLGAMLKCEWADVSLAKATILFRGRTQKNKRGQVHPLRPEAVQELALIQEPQRKLVWPLPYHRSNVTYHYKKLLSEAGLPYGRSDMFHKLRKTAATWFEQAGGNATELLGHASRKHTKDSYLDESQIERPHPASLLPALGQPIIDRRQPQNELERWLEAFLTVEATRVHRGRPTTPGAIKAIRHSCSRFIRWGRMATIADLTTDRMAEVAQGIEEACTETTYRVYRQHFQRFLRWLVAEGHDVASAIDAVESEPFLCTLAEEHEV